MAKQTPADLAAYLDEACNADTDLRHQSSGRADSREGIAIWTLVPEPSSAMLLAVGLFAIGSGKRAGRSENSPPQ